MGTSELLLLVACGVGFVALLVAFVALARSRRRDQTALDAGAESRRGVERLREELSAELVLQRRMLARVAAGTKLSADAIAEGRLWDDVEASIAKPALERGEWRALDVRTPQEIARGVIAGATCIPIDELERRAAELPKGARWLVYCASGARSAAACEWLSQAGYDDVHNLAGGIQSWPQGALERR
jgi:rhodanese-related sulfurtransferase